MSIECRRFVLGAWTDGDLKSLVEFRNIVRVQLSHIYTRCLCALDYLVFDPFVLSHRSVKRWKKIVKLKNIQKVNERMMRSEHSFSPSVRKKVRLSANLTQIYSCWILHYISVFSYEIMHRIRGSCNALFVRCFLIIRVEITKIKRVDIPLLLTLPCETDKININMQ